MKALFPKLPYLLKLLLLNLYALIKERKKVNRGVKEALSNYHRIDHEEQFHFDQKRFKKQIEGHPFFSSYQIEAYPISNKSTIKKAYEKIINPKAVTGFLHTSGTTGSGLKFPISDSFTHHQEAIFWKFRNIHGLNFKSWSAYIIGQTLFEVESKEAPFWITSYPTRQILFSQYHLNEKSVEAYLQELIKHQIKWLHAYPSVLNNFSHLIEKKNLSRLTRQLKIETITTSSEKLFSHQRAKIERTFHCKVRELYGLTEGVVNIFECEEGRLHIDESYSFVELIPKEGSDAYAIVGTSYHNPAFPLVRYDTGDTALLYEKGFRCECGRRSRLIKEILGRDEDYLLLEDGTKIGRLDHIFKEMVEVKEAQIYQEKRGEAIFSIVKEKSYNNASEERLKREIEAKLGSTFRYQLHYQEAIPRTTRGKLKFVINTSKEKER